MCRFVFDANNTLYTLRRFEIVKIGVGYVTVCIAKRT